MNKIISTVLASIVLTFGVLPAVPALADEPAAAPTCEQYLSEAQHREELLHEQVAAHQVIARVAARDLRQAERKIVRQQATIERLRQRLAAARR